MNLLQRILLVLILHLSCLLFAQKKNYYLDIDHKLISKEQFKNSINYAENLDVYFESDTAYFGKIVRRVNTGNLDAETFQLVKEYFQNNYNTKVEDDEYIVINYVTSYPLLKKRASKSKWNILRKKYLKKLHKLVKCQQFWIYDKKQKFLDKYDYKHINWLQEKDEFIKDLFYPYVFNYGNTTVISPDGRYYSFFGEYRPQEVYDGIEILRISN